MLSIDFKIGICMDNKKNMKKYKVNKNVVWINEVNKNLVCVLNVKNMV
ncbi:MAG: hypothetical protein LBT51_04720 [Fusobacteriaceae bacterium]|jgi:hypothetical protein|nr:hypothetical protein [Fusobacteriaceae bacterium]